VEDDESDLEEQHFVSIGAGAKNRIIVAVYCYRERIFVSSLLVWPNRVSASSIRRIDEA